LWVMPTDDEPVCAESAEYHMKRKGAAEASTTQSYHVQGFSSFIHRN
jgi:hypothetical protein